MVSSLIASGLTLTLVVLSVSGPYLGVTEAELRFHRRAG